MGARPTTSTMAGMVSGSKQMNSMTRLNHCTRSRIQIMVGTTRTTITTLVMTASSSVISMDDSSGGGPGYEAIAVQAATDQLPGLVPSKENLTMASSGSRKNSPKIVNV